MEPTDTAPQLGELEAVLAAIKKDENGIPNVTFGDDIAKAGNSIVSATIYATLGEGVGFIPLSKYLILCATLAPFLLQERRRLAEELESFEKYEHEDTRGEAEIAAQAESDLIDRLRLQLQQQEAIHESLVLRFGKLTVENMNLRDAIMGNAREVAMHIKTKGDMPTAYLSHPLFALFTQDMAEAFIETGAQNFLAIDMHSDKIGNVTATFQREGGKTPTQRLHEAEAEAQRLRERLREAEADADRLAGVVSSYGRSPGETNAL